jgi:hypothetical protein
MTLTNQQQIHRAYLKSPVWLAKRAEALSLYGTTCSRCGQFGSDVHHKTYQRVGGGELMSDLEILCRECHEAHHRAERATRVRRKRNSAINVFALARYLTTTQREILCSRFGLMWSAVFNAITLTRRQDITEAALAMLGKKKAYASQPRSRRVRFGRMPKSTRL